ncbi:MAG TPA: sigma-70 family RNA polymerase sigma factor, partial [Chloroflexota bacterium]
MATSVIGDDRDLAVRASMGDIQAFEELYRRHADGLYDFALRIGRDRALATDAVQTAFASAWSGLRGRTPPRHPLAWLYSLARSAAIEHGRGQSSGTDVDPLELAAIDPDRLNDPALADDAEMAALVWSAVAGLDSADYSLLDMHLRQKLSVDEIAENTGLRRGTVSDTVGDLSAALTDAVGYTLLLRRGRRQCRQLDAALAGGNERRVDVAARDTIEHHLETCEPCAENLRSYGSPADMFAGLAVLAPPAEMRESLWANLLRGAGVAPATQPRRRNLLAGRERPAALAGAGLIALLLLAFGGIKLTTRNTARDPGGVHSTNHQPGEVS